MVIDLQVKCVSVGVYMLQLLALGVTAKLQTRTVTFTWEWVLVGSQGWMGGEKGHKVTECVCVL